MKLFATLVAFFSFSFLSFAEETKPLEQEILRVIGVDSETARLPGVGLAEGITQVTGVAISPLLGVSALGSWNYFRTKPEDRHLLPWVCRPWFWGIGFGVLAIIFLKDVLGTIVPTFLKKPFDLLELFEDKFSALIAGSALIPFLVQQYGRHVHSAPPTVTEVSGSPFFASIPTPILAAIDPIWIFAPLAIVGFAVVWLVSHVINVIIAISPFGFLDAFLKVCRIGILTLLSGLYLVSPWLAAILALVIVAVCAYFAPRAFRFSFYGTVMAGDWFFSLFRTRLAKPEKIRCFLAKKGHRSLKVRTLGRVNVSANDGLTFRSRRFFFGPWRTVKLPNKGSLHLTNGTLFPVIQTEFDGKETDTLIHLLPRYRKLGPEVATVLGIEARETFSLRGITSAKRWLRDLVTPNEGPIADPQAPPV